MTISYIAYTILLHIFMLAVPFENQELFFVDANR